MRRYIAGICVAATAAGCDRAPTMPSQIELPPEPSLYVPRDTSMAEPAAFLLSGDTVSVVEFGAVPNDGLDDSPAFRAALERGGNVWVPEGHFDLQEHWVRVYENTRLFGAGPKSVIRMDAKGRTAQEYTYGFIAFGDWGANVKNIAIESLSFEGTASGQHVILALNVENFVLRKNRAHGLGFLVGGINRNIDFNHPSGDPHAAAGLISETQLSRNWIITDNIGDGTLPREKRTSWGVNVAYATDVYVARNTLENYSHGIQYWGGNGGYETGGRLDPPTSKMFKRGWIEGNTVRRVDGGLIWGSMGTDIVIKDNDVEDAGDVALDVEASDRVLVTGNRARNAVNGVLTVFMYSTGVVFEGNSVTQDGSLGKKLFHWYHDRSPGRNQVTLRGNRFFYTGADSVGTITKNPSKDFVLYGNEMYNTITALGDHWSGNVTVQNNRIYLDRSIGTSAAIRGGANHDEVQGGHLHVLGNHIRSVTRQGEAEAGIVAHQWGEFPVSTRIEDNVIAGFGRSIQAISSGGEHLWSITGNYIESDVEFEGLRTDAAVIKNNHRF